METKLKTDKYYVLTKSPDNCNHENNRCKWCKSGLLLRCVSNGFYYANGRQADNCLWCDAIKLKHVKPATKKEIIACLM